MSETKKKKHTTKYAVCVPRCGVVYDRHGRPSARCTGASFATLDGEAVEVEGGLDAVLRTAAYNKYDHVFVFDGNEFFGYIDYYAVRGKMPLWADVVADERRGASAHVSRECWSPCDSSAGSISRKIWLKTTDKYRHAPRIHATEWRSLRGLLGRLKLPQFLAAVGQPNDSSAETLAAAVKAFDALFTTATGVPFLGEKKPFALTIGAAAKQLYLSMRYPAAESRKAAEKEYRDDFPQDETVDKIFRRSSLLLGGIVCAPVRFKGVLFEKPLKKYDVNKLYSYIGRDAPRLIDPRFSTYEEYTKDKSGQYAYILTLSAATFVRKKGAPPVFLAPQKTVFEAQNRQDEDYIRIEEEFSIFGELLDALRDFYDVEYMDVVEVYKYRKESDPAARQYVDKFFPLSVAAKKEGNAGLSLIYKLLLNSLWGKFGQETDGRKSEYVYNKELDVVEIVDGDPFDGWKARHFDYVRGAYIYTLARIYMYNMIRRTFDGVRNKYVHIYYMDTDSIVTNIDLPADLVDGERLGAFKVECEYTAFGVVAPKTYYGRTVEGVDELKCAGFSADDIFVQIAAYERDGLITAAGNYPPQELFYYLSTGFSFDTLELCRLSGGSGRVTISATLGARYNARAEELDSTRKKIKKSCKKVVDNVFIV